jgi:hypothetical protein
MNSLEARDKMAVWDVSVHHPFTHATSLPVLARTLFWLN